MNGLEEMLRARMAGGVEELKPISIEEIEKGFQPITDLKPGEKVRAKSEKHNNYKMFSGGVVATVFRVGKFSENNSDSQTYENDFTALFAKDSAIAEFAFDSRRFERVTE